ncbi:MAG: D-2-hydroxyacid dehydrogenase [Bacillota bacterium]|nr:D-2-hydroxyacid dehydrogenase [Bacillota bacterium]
MRIVVLDGYALNPGDLSWEGLERFGKVEVYDRTSADKIIERIGDAEIVITNKTPITEEILSKCNIKYIGVTATGYNVVDTEAAKRQNIVVTNVPAYSTASVAQMVFAHILEVCQQVALHNEAVKSGEWTKSADFCFWKQPLMELEGKVMGVIGYGRIGQTVGRIAQAFGMRILAFSPRKNVSLESETMQYASLEELYKRADIISLHCPLFDATKGIINKETIAKMKDGVIIINTSRGPLIVEEDLAEALNSGKVYAAGVDVVSEEPVKADNPLLGARNIFITPHIAWAPKESRERLMNVVSGNLEAFLKGAPINVVNR